MSTGTRRFGEEGQRERARAPVHRVVQRLPLPLPLLPLLLLQVTRLSPPLLQLLLLPAVVRRQVASLPPALLLLLLALLSPAPVCLVLPWCR